MRCFVLVQQPVPSGTYDGVHLATERDEGVLHSGEQVQIAVSVKPVAQLRHPPDWRGPGRGHPLASVLLGVAFAAGWTPCISTTLGAILTLGLGQETTQAMVLASGYAFGLGVPFLLLSLFLERAIALTRRLQRYTRQIEIFSGLLLVAMGVLLLSNRLFYLALWTQRSGLYLDPQVSQVRVPTYHHVFCLWCRPTSAILVGNCVWSLLRL